MTDYRRAYDGKTYFFTVVTNGRRGFLCSEESRCTLREAIARTRMKRAFSIDAWVLLPNHLHCLWTLPEGDSDFSTRWGSIKSWYSSRMKGALGVSDTSESRRRKREAGVWQRRFWEHRIRDEKDFRTHMDYIHYNPVKHGLAESPAEWPCSTFHRMVAEGVYEPTWGGIPAPSGVCVDGEVWDG